MAPEKAPHALAPEIVALASDHGGFELKELLKKELAAKGYKLLDLGTNSSAAVDYPDYGLALAEAIASGQASRGIGICGSGVGISIAANRRAGVRAALVSDSLTARLCRQHNDANVLCLGARTTGVDVAKDCVHAFLSTQFEGGRHVRRVEKLG
ncbi:MAG: ribose 5-phosphate isomerase B [Alphaproteobacteria bacterium]|nr:ribose 5-phosphate isomerase B [Alphaproteobacteria bacterium]